MNDAVIKRHIVMVDDEPVNLELAENALKDSYKLTKLISGAQLLTFLARVKPDMILLDVQMPEMDGYEVIERINSDPRTKNIPVIFLTGQDGTESEKKGFMLGAKDFIRKPFDNEIMKARIRSQMALYLYQTDLEEIIDKKTKQISELHQMLTVGCAEMIESRDGTTGSHVRSTMEYFEILLKEMAQHDSYKTELCGDSIDELCKAAALHDIGKVGISDAILKKPGPLNAEELVEMRKHGQIGADVIGKIISQTGFDSFLASAKNMAQLHHERWDGTGYPAGLGEVEIPDYVRALSIVDVYDALTSVRSYKRAFTHEEAIDIITHDVGKFFDPDIYKIFMSIENRFKEHLLEKNAAAPNN